MGNIDLIIKADFATRCAASHSQTRAITSRNALCMWKAVEWIIATKLVCQGSNHDSFRHRSDFPWRSFPSSIWLRDPKVENCWSSTSVYGTTCAPSFSTCLYSTTCAHLAHSSTCWLSSSLCMYSSTGGPYSLWKILRYLQDDSRRHNSLPYDPNSGIATFPWYVRLTLLFSFWRTQGTLTWTVHKYTRVGVGLL